MSKSNPRFSKVEIGTVLENETHLIFFGNHQSSLANLKVHFPQCKFSLIKQVHGDKLALSPSDAEPPLEADAHHTAQAGVALCISTADCLPVMVFSDSPSEREILAIHAGWRGVLQEIVGKSIRSTFSDTSKIQIYIGPHIQFNSFEIEDTYRDQLVGILSQRALLSVPSTKAGKSLVNLAAVVSAQVEALGVPRENISIDSVDTLTDLSHHSFRRDGKSSGRQLSFICRK